VANIIKEYQRKREKYSESPVPTVAADVGTQVILNRLMPKL